MYTIVLNVLKLILFFYYILYTYILYWVVNLAIWDVSMYVYTDIHTTDLVVQRVMYCLYTFTGERIGRRLFR